MPSIPAVERALSGIPDVQLLRDRSLLSARQEASETALMIRPRTPSAVGAVLEALNQAHQPAVILAGNTGLVGANVPRDGEVVIDLSSLVNVLSLNLPGGESVVFRDARHEDLPNRLRIWDEDLSRAQRAGRLPIPLPTGSTITVEAAVTVDALNDLLRPLGWEYPMDMGSNGAATLGGCTANGSAGARALRNGTGADLAIRVEGYWANGSPVTPAEGTHPSPGRRNPCDREPRIDASRFPLGEHLIGSQGTLGIITTVEVRLSRLPLAHEVVLLGIDSLAQGVEIMAAAHQAFDGNHRSLELAELIDAASLTLVRKKEGISIPFDDPHTADAPDFLMLQARADTPAEGDALPERLLGFLESLGDRGARAFYDPTPGPDNAVRKVRHAITHASDARLHEMRNQEAKARGLPAASADLLTGRLGFDVAVPLDSADGFRSAWLAEVGAHYPELETNIFGHLGVGGFHIHHRGPFPPGEKARLMDDLARTVRRFGGTFCAEHGVGTLWAPMLRTHGDPAFLRQLDDWFARRDPRSILGPRSFAKGTVKT